MCGSCYTCCHVLCDSNGPFIRVMQGKTSKDAKVVADLDLDGNPYTVSGAVIVCTTGEGGPVTSPTTTNATVGRLAAASSGSSPAAMQSVTFLCISGTCTVAGQPISVGESVTFTGYFDNAANAYVRIPAIPYTVSGGVLHLTYIN